MKINAPPHIPERRDHPVLGYSSLMWFLTVVGILISLVQLRFELSVISSNGILLYYLIAFTFNGFFYFFFTFVAKYLLGGANKKIYTPSKNLFFDRLTGWLERALPLIFLGIVQFMLSTFGMAVLFLVPLMHLDGVEFYCWSILLIGTYMILNLLPIYQMPAFFFRILISMIMLRPYGPETWLAAHCLFAFMGYISRKSARVLGVMRRRLIVDTSD